jgi:hypothetical protein
MGNPTQGRRQGLAIDVILVPDNMQ